jgi:hypothetical protein
VVKFNFNFKFKKASPKLFRVESLDNYKSRAERSDRINMFFNKDNGKKLINSFIQLYSTNLSGIYFLMSGSEIIYIGQSKNIFTRPFAHKDKNHDRVIVLKIPKLLLDFVESAFIGLYLPVLNGIKNEIGRQKNQFYGADWGARNQHAFEFPIEALEHALKLLNGNPDKFNTIHEFVDFFDELVFKEILNCDRPDYGIKTRAEYKLLESQADEAKICP